MKEKVRGKIKPAIWVFRHWNSLIKKLCFCPHSCKSHKYLVEKECWSKQQKCFSLAREVSTVSLQMKPIRCFQARYGAVSVPALLSKWFGNPIINTFLIATSSSWVVSTRGIFHFIFSLVEDKGETGEQKTMSMSVPFLTDLPLMNWSGWINSVNLW